MVALLRRNSIPGEELCKLDAFSDHETPHVYSTGLGPAQDHSQSFLRDQKDLAPLLCMCSAPVALIQAGAAVCKPCLLMSHCSRSVNGSLDFK